VLQKGKNHNFSNGEAFSTFFCSYLQMNRTAGDNIINHHTYIDVFEVMNDIPAENV
jgi:hypothetical protein